MKLLFLLVFAPVCLAHCPDNHFKDDIFKKCVKCTPCHVTVTPCTSNKDAVCASFSDKSGKNHHFLKSRIHFLDDTYYDSLDDDFHAKNFLPHQKDHQRKNSKHLKLKHDDKHHHKQVKHFEFDDDDDEEDDDDNYDNYNDELDFNFEKFEKPKKHKKHYEFNNKKHFNKKKTHKDLSSEEEFDDEKLPFDLGKEEKKNKKKAGHKKKIDVDEEELEELLLQSKKKLEIRKDNFLKTLKDEKAAEKSNSKVRLNSPVLDSESDELHNYNKLKSSKDEKDFNSDSLKAFADLHDDEEDDGYESDDEDDDLDSFLPSGEESYKPVPPPHKPSSHSPSIIGQGKKVDETLRAEMGKNIIYEKSHFKVIPFVVGKDFNTEKNLYSQKYQPSVQKKQDTWNDESASEEYHEIKTNEVVSLPFTAAETLVWDWQAVAVASAVASCLVFFLVVAIYFIVNTRHWKKVNKNYKFEEVSTRIALMQPMLELGTSDPHTSSLYMENNTSPVKEDEKKGDMKV